MNSFELTGRNFMFVLLLTGWGLLPSCVPASIEKHPSREEPLWSVAEAAKRLALKDSQSELILIEISPEEDYLQEGHLPGAHQLWRPDYGTEAAMPYGGMRASRSQVAKLLGDLGIHPSDTILVYDNNGSVNATRFRWLLKMYGHQAIYLLDGGKKAWEMAGHTLDKIPAPIPEPTHYQFPMMEDRTELAHFDDILLALSDSNAILLDTREPEEYHGHPFLHNGEIVPWKEGAYDFGNIPNAVHVNWSEAVELKGDHSFKLPDVLRYNFEQAGVTPDKHIIVYCQSGVRSAHTTFVLKEILGYPYVRNYDGSWIEWSYFASSAQGIPAEKKLDPRDHEEMSFHLKRQTDSESIVE